MSERDVRHHEVLDRIEWTWAALAHWRAPINHDDLSGLGLFEARELMAREEQRLRALSEATMPWSTCVQCQKIRSRLHVWSRVFDSVTA